MDRLKKFSTILGFLIATLVLFWAVSIGVTKSEQNECLKWAQMAKERPDFYLTDAEQAQCDHYNIEVFGEEKKESSYYEHDYTQKGFASWYDYDLTGDKTDQKCTLDREPCYSQRTDTCASRDYPRGTYLEVRPVKLTRSIHSPAVYCRVNDYGPADMTRVIDLSSHAFQQLTDLHVGLLEVTISEVKTED